VIAKKRYAMLQLRLSQDTSYLRYPEQEITLNNRRILKEYSISLPLVLILPFKFVYSILPSQSDTSVILLSYQLHSDQIKLGRCANCMENMPYVNKHKELSNIIIENCEIRINLLPFENSGFHGGECEKC
jgi:hypothetical protein